MGSAAGQFFRVQLATPADILGIMELDPMPTTRDLRFAYVRRVIEAGNCHVAKTEQGATVAYAVLEHTFFDHGFVSMLYVGQDYRRKGIGSLLMSHLEGLCATPKLFTSTNRSNLPMLGLLPRLGYIRSGIVENLDDDDPELVFVKFLTPSPR
jgi:ribosomal protein S18 acetylase RimI-like enzyme